MLHLFCDQTGHLGDQTTSRLSGCRRAARPSLLLTATVVLSLVAAVLAVPPSPAAAAAWDAKTSKDYSLPTKSESDYGLGKEGVTAGLWFDDTHFYLADKWRDAVWAYKISDGSLDDDKHFWSLDDENGGAWGLWSDGTTMWISDIAGVPQGGGYIYAYKLSDGTRDPGKDFTGLRAAGNLRPHGIWSDGITMYVADYAADKVFAYKMSDRTRDTTREFDLVDDQESAVGMWSDGTTMWVANRDTPRKIFAYNLSTRSADPSRDFNWSAERTIHGLHGDSDSDTLWLYDASRQALRAFELPASTNNRPQLTTEIADQAAKAGTAFSYTVPAATFSDADSDTLTWSATRSDGTALPAWLSFAASTRVFSGTPAATDVDRVDVRVTASDGTHQNHVEFAIAVSPSGGNSAPTVAQAIADQSATADVPFRFTVPAGAFSDADSGTNLAYEAAFDYQTLPEWLTFDAATRTLSGTPWSYHRFVPVEVTITASDGIVSVSDTFEIAVAVDYEAGPARQGAVRSFGHHFSGTELRFVWQAPLDFLDQFMRFAYDGHRFWYQVRERSRTAGSAGAWTAWQQLTAPYNASDFAATGTGLSDIDLPNSEYTARSRDASREYEMEVVLVRRAPDGSEHRSAPASFVARRAGATDNQRVTYQPQNLGAVTFADRVELRWDAVGSQAVSGYRIWRRTAGRDPGAGAGATAVADTAATEYTDSSFDADTVYEYSVSAIADGEAGPPSDPVTVATLPAPPLPPTPLAPRSTESSVTLLWSHPGQSPPLGTSIFRQSSTETEFAFLTLTDETEYTDSDLQPQTEYLYRFWSWDRSGLSGWSELAASTERQAPNAAPTVATEIPDQHATVGVAFSYAFPATTFSDSDADALTYTAARPDGAPLPSWLEFSADSRAFTGEPAATDVGHLDVEVTADDGNGNAVSDTFHMTVNSTADFGWNPAKDFHTATSAAGNRETFGVWSNGTTMWVADREDAKIYAYRLSDMSRVPAADFDTLAAAGNTKPFGLWSDGTTMWVVNHVDFYTSGQKIYAYKMNPGQSDHGEHDSAKDFDGLRAAKNLHPTGIWSDGATMWVADDHEDMVFAYRMNPGQSDHGDRDAANDRRLLRENHRPTGMWSDGTTLWVGERYFDKIFAYRLSDMKHIPVKDFNTLSPIRNNTPIGLWSDGNTMWVSDYIDHKVYAYNMPPANVAPMLQRQIPDQTATEGTAFSYAFPEETFIDPEGDALTYSAARSNGAELPQWLSLDALKRSFSGTPGPGSVGQIAVKVTADDGNGHTVSDTFQMTVGEGPTAPTDVAVAVGDVFADVSWTLPLQSEGSGLYGVDEMFLERLDSSGAVVWSSREAVEPLGGSVWSKQVSGLEPGTAYWFRVRLVGDDGSESWSAVVPATTRSESPVAPSGLAAVESAEGVTLSWSVPQQPSWVSGFDVGPLRVLRETAGREGGFDDDVGSAVELVGAVAWDPAVGSYSLVDADVGEGVSNRYRVSAGFGSAVLYSDPVVFTTAGVGADPDGSPSGAFVLNYVEVWRAPQYYHGRSLDRAGGDAVDYYQFRVAERAQVGIGVRDQTIDIDVTLEDGDGNVVTRSWPPPGNPTIEWLKATVDPGLYYVRVEAADDAASPYYLRFDTAALPEAEAVAPHGLEAVASPGEVGLSWTVPAQPAGVSVRGVHVERGGSDGSFDETFQASAPASGSVWSWTDSDVVSGGEYRYRVRLSTTAGEDHTNTVAVTALASDDATLASLSLDGIDIGSFDPAVAAYSARVGYEVDSTAVTAAPAHSAATAAVTLGGVAAAGGAVDLAVGFNDITVTVTAQNGDTSTTTIRVQRSAASPDTGLASVDFSDIYGAANPTTGPHAQTVSHRIERTTITAVPTHPAAAVAVKTGGVTAVGGAVELAVGDNHITVEVTAQDGTVAVYSFVITRDPGAAACLPHNVDTIGLDTADSVVVTTAWLLDNLSTLYNGDPVVVSADGVAAIFNADGYAINIDTLQSVTLSGGDSIDGYWDTIDGVRGFAYPGDMITHVTYTPDCTHTTGH